MRMLEDKTVTRNERIMVLATNTRPLLLLVAGFITSLIVLAICGGALLLFGTMLKTSQPLVLPNVYLVYFAAFFLIFGALTARLKMVQFALRRAAYRGSAFYDIVASGLNFIFPMAIFTFVFILQVSLLTFSSEDPWSTSMIYLVIGLFCTMVLKQLWDFFFGNVLIATTSVDWRLIVDKERFTQMLRLRFDESKRYPGPFVMMMIGVKDYEGLVAGGSPKQVIAFQEKLIDFINRQMRTVDIVARLEQGQYIGTLLHTSNVEAKIPAQRINDVAREVDFTVGHKKVTPVFRFGIASFEQSMQHERELYEKAMKALAETTDENTVVLR